MVGVVCVVCVVGVVGVHGRDETDLGFPRHQQSLQLLERYIPLRLHSLHLCLCLRAL